MHHEIAALNRVFHDDIESRNDLGVAREIRRVIVPKKIILIFFHYRLLKRMISNKMNEPPPRHHVWIALFCHLIFICNDPNPKEKLHLNHPMPRIRANIGMKEQGHIHGIRCSETRR